MSVVPARFPQGPVVDQATSTITLEWQQWLQNPSFGSVEIATPLPITSGGTGAETALQDVLEMAGPLYPAIPTGSTTGTAQQVSSLWAGSGVPNNAGGANGDFYFRSDGAVGSNIYKKAAGLWAAIL